MSDISLNNERIILVGGGGFIGHHLALGLRKVGAEVLVVDNMQINNIVKILTDSNLDEKRRKLYSKFIIDRFDLLRKNNVEIDTLDARNLNELTTSFTNFQPTKAVHLAAISSAVSANKTPSLAYDIQINSLRNLLLLCEMKNSLCQHVCFLSSSTVYGDFKGSSVNETFRPQPRGVYANGKYIGERMVREVKDLHGIAYTIIRPSALYGIRCISGRVSQKFIENAMLGKPLILEGGGSGTLDFTHIDDLVQGIVRSLALEGGKNKTFNITFGNAKPISDLAKIIKTILPEVKIENGPPVPEKPKRGTLEIGRSKKYLGFTPEIDISTGYKEFCNWYLSEWQNVK